MDKQAKPKAVATSMWAPRTAMPVLESPADAPGHPAPRRSASLGYRLAQTALQPGRVPAATGRERTSPGAEEARNRRRQGGTHQKPEGSQDLRNGCGILER